MNTVKCKLLYLILLISYISVVYPQQYTITNYTKDRGLPGNQIWGIFQDQRGYMWFCTSSGLINYNGKKYKIFRKDNGLLDDTPLDIAGDTKGNLWIAYDYGISKLGEHGIRNWFLKETEGHFSLYRDSYDRVWAHSLFFPGDVVYFQKDSLINFAEEYNFKNQVIVNITEDKKGGIFFITREGKLFRFFTNNLEELAIKELLNVRIRYAFFDQENNFIICSERGLGVIENGYLDKNPSVRWILSIAANYGMQSENGYYWFASENGIYRFKDIKQKQTNFIHITEHNGLRSNIVYRVFEDYEGNLWIGYSEKGISKISSLMFSKYGKKEGLVSDAIFSVTEDKNFFIVSADKGLFKFDGRKFDFIVPSSQFSKRWYFTVLPYSESEVLLGSTPGIISLSNFSTYKITGLERKIIYSLLKDHLGNVWVGTNTGLYLKNNEDFVEQDYILSETEINKLLEVNNSDLYIGTTRGLIIIKNGTIPFAQKNIIKPEETKLPPLSVNDMIENDEGEIILACGKGLQVIDKQNQVTTIDELKNTQIIVLHLDRNKRLWAGSNASGLFVLQKNGGKYEVVSHYNYRDGISSDEFAYNNSICEDENGKLYFGMFDGLTVYDPSEDRIITEAPRVYITGLIVNDSTYSITDIAESELSPSQNKISFICDGLSFYNEDALKFQYYLSNIENEWANVTLNPEITYGYLQPGNYTFFIRAVNQFGIASQPQSISFTILAPFWKRFWFILISVLIVIAAAYKVYVYRLSSIRKRNLQLEQIVKEKTHDLQESKMQVEEQYNRLIEAQKELVGKQELEKAHQEIQLLKDRLEKENIYLREKQGAVQELSSIIGRSPGILEIRKKIQQIAKTDSTVLITGETGVGKNLVAEAIHNTSLRKDRALIVVNCAAIPEALVESELFGHEKGAFTGADKSHIGKFEVADGSTIFLDEIGDMNLTVQAKVLNVIQSKKITRIGSHQEINVDVRIIAATNHDLEERVKEGKFRQDLFYRINVYPIRIPPLRECKEDIEPLAKYFIDRYSKLLDKKISAITKSALDLLKNHTYPGNVRELENIIHRSVIITKNNLISDEDILLNLNSPIIKQEDNFQGDIITLELMEKQYIMHVLKKTNGRISGKSGAADLLGINPSTLRSRIKKLGISFQESN